MTEEQVQRRLAAILAADVVGYSALMQRAEEATYVEFERLKRELIEPSLSRHKGRLIKTTGDGALAEFASPLAAVRCAVDIQDHLASSSSPFKLRIGLNLGDVIVGPDGELYGDGINIAVRLEGAADPGGILISEKVYSEVEGKLDVGFEGRGEQQLKNIAKPVRAYAVRAGAHGTVTERLSAAPPLPDKPSIAVLPFQNMSGDPEQEYFADGMAEDIITALSRFKALFVIARHSSFTYKGRAVDVKQVGRELGVRYVLEGSVRKAANRVRITGQLVDTATGTHLWADRFDGGLSDIFDLQDQVTESVVAAIAPAVEKAEIERAKRKPTESLDAYTLHLRGLAKLYQFNNRQANDEALRLFNKATELDPDFASAYGRAASCYVDAKSCGWISATANEIAEVSRLAQRAVELGKDDAIAIALSGRALAYVARDLEGGAALTDRALALNSNSAEAWYGGGWVKIWLGEPKLAIERFARAMRLSPLDPWITQMQAGTAHSHFFLGRYDEAASWAAMALQDSSDLQTGLRIGAASNAMAGRLEQAHKAVAWLRQLNPALRVSTLKQVLGPYRRAEDLLRYEEGLRKAGLPE
ncbi:adenylate/guanylate cyclase domain-containing protein [Bradyrhizobium iriomotense]|uniref:Adenylate cyclase n=1 Tax=Bradyrhizobium iriomotense TaxID=441950 RepID=A0ABQ6BEC3_9BRAD|nr:adenylate/guanylate cyclase domain-containing protein [Bradyrhizobium iriomotense]GLR91300.1 adenylate cyclase [Bradyrhizobium iriomotense]